MKKIKKIDCVCSLETQQEKSQGMGRAYTTIYTMA
jgi:hypothetical protein